jgi:hypothetical protein
LLAFKKRHRAINYQSHEIRCDKIIERYDPKDIEKIEIKLSALDKTRIALNIWEDRWVLVDARQSTKKGWAWEWRYDGRLLGLHTGKDLIAALEQTMAATFQITRDATDDLTRIWRPLLARGPKDATGRR